MTEAYLPHVDALDRLERGMRLERHLIEALEHIAAVPEWWQGKVAREALAHVRVGSARFGGSRMSDQRQEARSAATTESPAEMLRGLIFNWIPSPAKPKANAALDALEAEIERLQRANEKLRQQVRGIGGA